ncbi:hypothetical protein RFI_28589 [Reticulomyxa filosa]|uniref:Uncharacterized protein n=1 Tax=Reticulomyxa filosa TaxID=46433 RepID=X6M478_RETFI|nr:hypothetical protein RFI_28589 [Reticulomyxa filosa]|eukprot:ETO08798.1 hypothetical protein RFI_28589 [Reticulomyxa filosa]
MDEWKKNLQLWNQGDKQLLDCAVDSWTDVVEPAKRSIGTRIIWEGNKHWSDSLHRKRKQVHRLKRKYLFSQFKSMNLNKISVIPALVESTTGNIAKTDKDKAEMLSVIEMDRDEEMSCYPLCIFYQGSDNIHNQMIKNGGQALIDSLVGKNHYNETDVVFK